MDNDCKMWFGTKDYATYIETPLSGSDSSPAGWNDGGTLLGGNAFQINSFNTHKRYVYSWPASSSREDAQLMKSFYDGTFGRGKIYFQDPLTLDTNVLPARWADPSITADFEGPSLVPGVNPVTTPNTDFQYLRLPVKTTVYGLNNTPPATGTRFVEEARNYFKNPNLVGSGTWVEAYRNYFTNPNLVGDGTYTEIRRNLHPNPNPWSSGSMDHYSSSNGEATLARVGQALRWTFNTTALAGVRFGNSGSTIAGIVEGVKYRMKVRVRGSKAGMQVRGGFSGGPVGAYQTLGTAWTWLEFEGVAGNLSDYYLGLYSLGHAVGDWVEVARVCVEKADTPNGSWFTGDGEGQGIEGTTTDPDFRARWLGEPNSSQSVLEGQNVRALTGVRCAAIVSTWNGKPALRLIPTVPYAAAADTYSYAWFAIPAGARAAGTIVATRHQKALLTGPTSSGYLGHRVGSPYQAAGSGVNVAGDVEMRGGYSLLASLYRWEIGNGAALGGGDVWYTDLGMFGPGYSGPVFSGNAVPSGFDQPEDFRARWEGEPNMSDSLIEGEAVLGITTAKCVAIRSSRSGKPAVRVVTAPLTDTTGYRAYFTVPTAVRNEGLAVATRYMKTARSAGSESFSSTLSVGDPLRGIGSPQVGGDTPLSLSWGGDSGGAPITSTFRVYLYGDGPSIGRVSQDVWWYDIGLFNRSYTGPVFSGNSIIPGKVVKWESAPNASDSLLGYLDASGPANVSDDNAVFIPIPDGMQLNLGAFYKATNTTSGVYVSGAARGGAPTSRLIRLTPLETSATNLFPDVITKEPGMVGVYLWIGRTLAVDSTVSVSAIHARLSPLGAAPTGPPYWVGGQGHSGVRFDAPPTYVPMTGVDGGQIEYAASFIESVL